MTKSSRNLAAAFIRQVRREMPFHTLNGGWTIREWNRTTRAQAYDVANRVDRFKKSFGGN